MILNLLLLSQLDARASSQPLFLDTATFVQRQPFGGGVRLLPHCNWFCKKAVNRGGRSLRIVVLILFAAMALLISRATAAVHPVPLEQNVDAKKCLECHEDKSKGKFVHSAIATGCLSCHEVRVNKDITRVKLITTTPQSLCLTCHADKDAASLKGTVHPPAVRDCIKCHDPHTSDNKNQLLKPTSGDKGKNLCLDCHNQGVNVPEKGSRHAALDMGCDTCHVTHKVGEKKKQEFDYHLTKAVPALCIDCHDVKDEALIKAHRGQPFATATCTQCHDPHQSAQPKLMQKFIHPPFADRTCEICHEPAKEGKVVLTNADTRALCATCHSDQVEKIDKAKVPHPGAQGECVACHNPHAGKTPGFLQPDPVSACLACHSEQADEFKKAHVHQPAFQQGCAICHEPHGGDNDHLLRTKKPDTICLECHGPDAEPPKKLEAEHLITILDGRVKLPEDYFIKNKAVVLPLKYGRGHPVDGHPVADVVDPSDITKLRAQINCLSCHQPHASAQPNLLVKDQANNAVFCASCHKDLTRR
jgi:predicted CXXCH cytochrome family protein